jgi:hypothetical protein
MTSELNATNETKQSREPLQTPLPLALQTPAGRSSGLTDSVPKVFSKSERVVKIFGLDEDVGIKQETRQFDQLLGSGCLFVVHKARPLLPV